MPDIEYKPANVNDDARTLAVADFQELERRGMSEHGIRHLLEWKLSRMNQLSDNDFDTLIQYFRETQNAER